MDRENGELTEERIETGENKSMRFTYDIVHRKDICSIPIQPHTHDATEIYLSLSPLPGVLLGSRVIAVRPGTLIVIPPFCVHRLFDKTDEVYDRYILSVNAAWLDGIFFSQAMRYEYLKAGQQPLLLPLSAALQNLLLQKFEFLLSFPENDTFSAMAAFFDCMALVNDRIQLRDEELSEGIRVSASQRTVADILRYLNEHIRETVSLRELSEHFYLHPDYISRIFKKHTNTTVGNYITLQKMALARQLLSEGSTVTQTQLMTGYSSYAHFSRTFKQQVGMPPGAYRTQNAPHSLTSDPPAVPSFAVSPP